MLYGCDISEFQGQINWDLLNSVANFVIIREGFGTSRQDLQYQRNRSEAHRVRASAGPLGIGLYHFAYPQYNSPEAEAHFFVANVLPLQEGELLVLDFEQPSPNTPPVEWCLRFLQTVESATGVKPLIYLNQSQVTGNDWSSVINGGYGLWLAEYDGQKNMNTIVVPWSVVAIKQWTDADVVLGISGKVDGDVFNGDFNAWDAYGYKVAQASPPPAPVETPPVAQPVPAPSPTPTPTPPVVETPTPVAPPVKTPSKIPVTTPQPTPKQSLWQWIVKAFKSIFKW
jgi:GH25 family lysozyme M1 (1,4-beta-N-acetylmuramidase)